MPPIDEQKARYGSLAGSHLNIGSRIIQVGSAGASPAGDVRSLVDESASLNDAAMKGH